MNTTKLANAIATLLAGSSLTLLGVSSAAASTSYYNTDKPIETTLSDPNRYSDNAGLGVDGWMTTGEQAKNGTDHLWLGTPGGARPFGYTGSSATNWAAYISNAGDSLEISQANAASLYGVNWGSAPSSLVNIDTVKGGWQDGNGYGDRAHNVDIGLFKSEVNALKLCHITQNIYPNLVISLN